MRSYPKVWNLGHEAIAELFAEPVEVTEKIDGCFSGGTLVHLADGSKEPIADLVRRRFDGWVTAFDSATMSYVDSRVRNCFEYPPSHKDLVRVKVLGSGHSSRNSFSCTEDHLVFTDHGWLEAARLSPGHQVLLHRERLSFLQEQVVLGGILGDGYVAPGDTPGANAKCVLSHSERCLEYNAFLAAVLGDFLAGVDNRPGGYPGSGGTIRVSSKSHYVWNPFREHFYPSGGTKRIPAPFLKARLSPLSLAIWYMDDGSCNFTDSQRPRPAFHTEGFSEGDDVEAIVGLLGECFGLRASISRDGRGPVVWVSSYSAERFFHLIAPYILGEFKYKVPEPYRAIPCALPGLLEAEQRVDSGFLSQPVVEVSPASPQRQFDLETEHRNYLVSSTGVLVHNSQFSFSRLLEGQLAFRSRNQAFDEHTAPGMFRAGVEAVQSIARRLNPGWIYRGEYLAKPKHNCLAYDRIPEKHIILFDVEISDGKFISDATELRAEAETLGLQTVPSFGCLKIQSVEDVLELMDRESCLGGQKIEGLVFKNYRRWGVDGKVLMGKHVAERFKEKQAKAWRVDNPTQGDVVTRLIEELRTEARWAKAVQHLRERGELVDQPKDIGALVRELQADTQEECAAEIKQALFAWAWPKISRGVIRGLPEYYKGKLAERQFSGGGES